MMEKTLIQMEKQNKQSQELERQIDNQRDEMLALESSEEDDDKI